MHLGDCWAYREDVRFDVMPVNEQAGLVMSAGMKGTDEAMELRLTLNRQQLFDLRTKIDHYLVTHSVAPGPCVVDVVGGKEKTAAGQAAVTR